MPQRNPNVDTVIGLIGAAVGGAAGFYAFGWVLSKNYYALVLPGGLLGFGCSVLARYPSFSRGLICGACALALGLFSEWWYRPFDADKSLPYFLGNLGQLDSPAITFGMIALGTAIAFWLGKEGRTVRISAPSGPSI